MARAWSQSESELLDELSTNRERGLSVHVAKERLSRHGRNQITQKNSRPVWRVLLHQFQSPLSLILIGAVIVSFVQGEVTDAVTVAAVIVLNTLIGFFQEYRAERTIDKLRQSLAETARVVRDGVEQKIAAELLVPGDMIILEAGDRVPGDARLIEAQNLRVNEAALTGEAVPAHKRDGVVKEGALLFERVNMLFMSTFLVDGRAVAVVTSTGMQTEIGAISQEVGRVREAETFLQAKMARFGRVLLGVALAMVAVIFIVGLSQNFNSGEMLRLALSMLVAVVPEGLPVAVTVVLSVGLLRMYRRHALIRRLSAAETLGSATIICVDKTGTLTEGKMMVERLITLDQELIVTGHGYSLSGQFTSDQRPVVVTKLLTVRTLLELASLATMSTIAKDDLENDQAKQLTDPTETALAVVAAKAGFYAFREEKTHPELLEMPFDQELRYSTSIHRFGNHNRLITKGSPERVLQLSSHVLGGDGKRRRLLGPTKTKLEEQASDTARQGYRLVALGFVDQPKSAPLKQSAIKDLTFVGFLAIADPIRSDVRAAVATAKKAGVRVMMLTGDHLLTAETIARRVGLDAHGEVIHAADLAHHDLNSVSVIARATPADKLKIIEKLQRSGEIVAMTGDGVNDAPALKRADIGIAMGRSGTAVAIEAAQMVLLRDNFSAIVAAIEEGRLIWENLRKVVFYLTSTTLAEVLMLIVCLLLGLPLPMLAIQILWMNLVTDGIMSMALTVEPSHQDLMNGRNRAAQAGQLLDGPMVRRMLLVSAVMMAGSLVIYLATLDHGVEYARTATLTSLVFFQLLNVFNARSSTRSVFTLSLLSNRLLIVSFVSAALIHLVAIYVPVVNHFLGTVPLPGQTVLAILAISASILLVDELRKASRTLALQWARLQNTEVAE